jgi:hypothetical protein
LKAGLLEAGLGCAWGGHAGHASSALVLAGQLALGCTQQGSIGWVGSLCQGRTHGGHYKAADNKN